MNINKYQIGLVIKLPNKIPERQSIIQRNSISRGIRNPNNQEICLDLSSISFQKRNANKYKKKVIYFGN